MSYVVYIFIFRHEIFVVISSMEQYWLIYHIGNSSFSHIVLNFRDIPPSGHSQNFLKIPDDTEQ